MCLSFVKTLICSLYSLMSLNLQNNDNEHQEKEKSINYSVEKFVNPKCYFLKRDNKPRTNTAKRILQPGIRIGYHSTAKLDKVYFSKTLHIYTAMN